MKYFSINELNRDFYICRCPRGFIGDICEIPAKCVNCKVPCDSSHKCQICKTGWVGDYCLTLSCLNFKMCKNGGKSLKNRGVCIVDIEKQIRYCRCPSDYIGEFCEIKILLFFNKISEYEEMESPKTTNATKTPNTTKISQKPPLPKSKVNYYLYR